MFLTQTSLVATLVHSASTKDALLEFAMDYAYVKAALMNALHATRTILKFNAESVTKAIRFLIFPRLGNLVTMVYRIRMMMHVMKTVNVLV